MNPERVGIMQLSQEQKQRYVDQICEDSSGAYNCPRCEKYSRSNKQNVIRHIQDRQKACKEKETSSTPTLHQSFSRASPHHNTHLHTNTHNDLSVHTTHNDHSVHNTIINNIFNITLQPFNTTHYNKAWQDVFEQSLKTIEKDLACELTDPAGVLLACCKYQHLNTDLPQQNSVRIREGELEMYCGRRHPKWTQYPMEDGLKDLVCRRRDDIQDVEAKLQAKMSPKRWKQLDDGLDELADVSNGHECKSAEVRATFDKLLNDLEAAIAQFCNL